MSANPPSSNPNPDLRFKLFALLLLTSFALCPVNSRPSTSAESPRLPTDHHGNIDTVPQQSENMGHENQERIIPEVKLSEEQDTSDESEADYSEPVDPEDYPQQDMYAVPMGDAAGNNGGRKGEAKHPKSSHHSGKSGRRNGADHQSVTKPGQEGNDTNDGASEDPEQLNRSLSNGSASNMTTSEENYMKLSKNNRESQEFDQADRNKVLRINEIKERIQNYRLGSGAVDPKPTNVPIDELVKLMDMNITHSSAMDAYPMKRRSFHPSCTAPNNTDVDLWTNGNSMNLLYNLTYPAQQNTTVTIIAATLRLYKFSQGNRTLMAHPCRPVIGSPKSHDHADEDEQEQEPQADSPVLLEAPELPTDDDKQLRVSVYWYTRSLKKNKVKRKLLDSRMLPVYGKGGWIEFNVRPAARQWRLLGKNFGLVVEVENEDGELLKASDYFTAMNCSNEASTSRPLPRVLLQAAQSYLESNYASARTGFDISPIIASGPEFTYTNPISNAFPDITGKKGEAELGDEDTPRRIINSPYIYSFLFPVIDLCTIEVPAQEAANAAFLHHAQYLLTQHSLACKSGNLQNHTEFMILHGTTIRPTQIHLMTEEANRTENVDVNNQTEEFNNISHIQHEGHKKDHRHNGHHAARLAAIPEDMFPPMQDSPRAVKIRHSRHHLDEKHRHRDQSSNQQFEETVKRRITNGENEKESEEFKEQVTWTDENGQEFKKIIFQEVIRSENSHDASSLPPRESDR